MSSDHDHMPSTSLSVAARWAIGLGLLAGSAGFAWFLSTDVQSPTVARSFTPEDPARAEERAAARATSLEREAAYDAAVAADAIPTPEQIKLLEAALESQRTFLRAQPSPVWADSERGRMLEGRIATARGRVMLADSERLEKQADDLFAAGDRPGGVTALQEAVRLQREINLSPADSSVRRTMREAELAARLDAIEAEPLAAEVERLETAAQAASAAGDHVTAMRQFEEAAGFQRRLNQLFARTRFASTARLDRLESEIASLGAGRLVRERDELITAARERDEAGAAAEAANLFVQAREVQAKINQDFAHSRFASGARLDELEVARQTALSRPRFAVFAGLEEKIAAALRARRADEARDLIEKAKSEAESLQRDTPRSQLLTPGWRTRVDYLASIVTVLPIVQADLLDHLRPVPGTPVKMSANEISQGIYAAIVGSNPARVQGNRLPVESLTAAEAGEFCRRLSWALGRLVRLPTRAEFSAAMGSGGDDAWTAENAGGMPRAVDAGDANEAGFRNLRGNAGEWVSGVAADQMLIAGGSYADQALATGEAPFKLAPQTERFRTVGFRVVVE